MGYLQREEEEEKELGFFREVSRNDCIAKDARRLHLKEETQQIKMIVETKRELTWLFPRKEWHTTIYSDTASTTHFVLLMSTMILNL